MTMNTMVGITTIMGTTMIKAINRATAIEDTGRFGTAVWQQFVAPKAFISITVIN